jgi:hypothetical protein
MNDNKYILLIKGYLNQVTLNVMNQLYSKVMNQLVDVNDTVMY